MKVSNDDVLMRLLAERLKNAISEQAEILDKTKIQLNVQQKMSEVWERDGYISGFVIGSLLHMSTIPLYDVIAEEIEKLKNDYLKKFGGPVGFARGFLDFQKVITKVSPQKQPATPKRR